ncbi:Dabb family protein [Fundidesulfovibrio butyratiphilus]
MIKHIVLWRLKDQAEGRSKAENLIEMRSRLAALPDLVPGARNFSVSTQILAADPAADIVLYCEFDTRLDLETYAAHPDHVAVVEFIKKVVEERRVVDAIV